MKKRITLLLLFTLITTGCTSLKTEESVQDSRFFFDTIITITVYGTSDTQILEDCFSLCTYYESLLSKTINTSDISKVNERTTNTVAINKETAYVIQKSLDLNIATNGAFDVTTAPYSDLWDFTQSTSTDSASLPDANALISASKWVGSHHIAIGETSITLDNANTAIDLGGIAKGYIADKLKDYLLSEKIKYALINLGGDIQTIGTKPDGSNWTVGIQKPFDPTNTSIDSVQVNNKAVVTSGIYERYFTIDNTVYHHILDPQTGYPINNNLYSVTIIADSCADADALSTACFVLGLEKGLGLIESLPNTEAIFITDEYELLYSSGI